MYDRKRECRKYTNKGNAKKFMILCELKKTSVDRKLVNCKLTSVQKIRIPINYNFANSPSE